METHPFLTAQREDAHLIERTPRVVRSLIFSLVDAAARSHYADHYPIKCLQTSVAVQSLLERFGIGSTLWQGGICVAQVFERDKTLSWGGFWGENHHIWLITQFNEYVDLAIGQLHRHPNRSRDDAIAMPPIWWDEAGRWPSVIKYLPFSRVRPDLQGLAAHDLNTFVQLADTALERKLQARASQEVEFGPILHGPKGLNDLFEQGCPWVVRAIEFEQGSVLLPDEVLELEQALIAQWRERRS
jgi:hypothetical protein